MENDNFRWCPSTDVIVRNNPVKYEANFIIRLLLLSEMICA